MAKQLKGMIPEEEIRLSFTEAYTAYDVDGLDEINLSTVAKLGIGYLALKGVGTLFKSKSIKTSRNAARDYAQQLTNARNNQEVVAATLGLLSVCGNVLNQISGLKFLGSKIMDVAKNTAIKNYIEKGK